MFHYYFKLIRSNRYDNFAHIGGFVGGIMITLMVLPIISAEHPSSESQTFAVKFDEQIILLWMIRIMATAFITILMWIALHLLMEGGEQIIKDSTIVDG